MPILDLALQLDLELRTAMRLVQEAGNAILAVSQRPEPVSSEQKSDHTPVTEADLASDRLIREGLLQQFPEDGIVSEESSPTASASGRHWVLDPLDGTRAFVAGGHDYVVQLGLLNAEGVPVLGCVFEPVTRRLYHAISGVGAFMSVGGTGSTIRQTRVSRRSLREEMPLMTSSSMDDPHRLSLLSKVGCADGGAARSVGYKIGRLVRREVDIYYSGHAVSVWDTCGPLVVLEASGGVITGMDGAPLKFDVANGQTVHRGPFVASNAQDHADIVLSLRNALKDVG